MPLFHGALGVVSLAISSKVYMAELLYGGRQAYAGVGWLREFTSALARSGPYGGWRRDDRGRNMLSADISYTTWVSNGRIMSSVEVAL